MQWYWQNALKYEFTSKYANIIFKTKNEYILFYTLCYEMKRAYIFNYN